MGQPLGFRAHPGPSRRASARKCGEGWEPSPEPPRVSDYRPPRPIEQPRPVMNLFVRQALAGVRGSAVQVSVEITVDANGRVSSIKPFTATDSVPKGYGQRRADAARRWKFEPARLNGQAVAGSNDPHVQVCGDRRKLGGELRRTPGPG